MKTSADTLLCPSPTVLVLVRAPELLPWQKSPLTWQSTTTLVPNKVTPHCLRTLDAKFVHNGDKVGGGFFVTGVCGSGEGGGAEGGVPVPASGGWIGHAGR